MGVPTSVSEEAIRQMFQYTKAVRVEQDTQNKKIVRVIWTFEFDSEEQATQYKKNAVTYYKQLFKK
jgi:hypothetical protein